MSWENFGDVGIWMILIITAICIVYEAKADSYTAMPGRHYEPKGHEDES